MMPVVCGRPTSHGKAVLTDVRRTGVPMKVVTYIGFALIVALCAQSVAWAQEFNWDGTWTGKWGGRVDTTVVVKKGQVVEYIYNGVQQRVGSTGIAGYVL